MHTLASDRKKEGCDRHDELAIKQPIFMEMKPNQGCQVFVLPKRYSHWKGL
jgi:hypothetical protein